MSTNVIDIADRRRQSASQQIILRALEPEDDTLLYQWENDPSAWEVSDRRWPISLSDIKDFIAHSDLDLWHTRQMRLMIVQKSDCTTVGCVDIFDFDPLNLNCSIGIFVAPGFRHKGIGVEAVSEICRMAFRTFGVHTVMATVEEGNAASRAMLRSAGFVETGRRVGFLRHGDTFADEIVMQLFDSKR